MQVLEGHDGRECNRASDESVRARLTAAFQPARGGSATTAAAPPIADSRPDEVHTLVDGLQSTLGARLRSVVAVGSLGRMVREATPRAQLEDYDLIAIVTGASAVARRIYRRRLDAWLYSLRGTLSLPVSVGMLPVRRLPNLPCTLFNYELRYGSLPLWGEDMTAHMPGYESAAIPLVEATRLLVNRGVLVWGAAALTAARPEVIVSTGLGSQYRKVLIALGDALLIRDGLFHWSYGRRAENARQCYGFDRFRAAGLRERYVAALETKRNGTGASLPQTDVFQAIAELLSLHEAVFRCVEEQRLGGHCPAWPGYAAAGVSFPRSVTGSPVKRLARLVRCFGPPRGTGFYLRNAGRSDEEVLTAAFPILAYDGVQDSEAVGRLLNHPSGGPLTGLGVWERFHHVWAKGH